MTVEIPAGVPADVADERGYRRIEVPEELEAAMRADGFQTHWSTSRALVVSDGDRSWEYTRGGFLEHLPGLLIPVWWGGRIVGHDFRFDTPPLDTENRPQKYKFAYGAPQVMDAPPRVQPLLADPSQFLVITEGVKKADALAARGVAAIALRGVQAWSLKKGSADDDRQLLPQWSDVALEGRKVGILFDSDAVTKWQVQAEMRLLAHRLRERGAIVKWTPIPTWNGSKAGIDDFLEAGYTLADLRDWREVPMPLKATPRERINSSPHVPLAQMVDEAWAALQRLPVESLLVRGNDLSRLTGAELSPHTIHSLKIELSRVADFGSLDAQGRWRSKPIPNDVINGLLDQASYTCERFVDRVVDVPIVGRSGNIITSAGIHPEDRIFYVPSIDLLNKQVQPWEVFDPDDIESAKNFLLEDLLGDFAFYGDEGSVDWHANRANALALLLLPFVRDLIDGPTPLHLAVATTPGTGKGLLVNTALLPSLGNMPSTTQVPEGMNDDEWRKSLLSAMSRGVSALRLDNAPTNIDARPLASALTSPYVEGRELGTNRWMKLPVRHVWTMTGNNTELSRELIRRTVLLHLDPGDEVPAERDPKVWRHYPKNLEDWAMDNRHDLVSAALTLINHWLLGEARIVNGEFMREPWRVRSRFNLGSFEKWSEVIGGILEACNVQHFMGNMSHLRAPIDDVADDTVQFLTAWYEQGWEPLSFAELLQKCTPMAPLHAALPTELVGLDTRTFRHKFMAWLRENRDVSNGGLKLRRSGAKPRNRWSVERNGSAS